MIMNDNNKTISYPYLILYIRIGFGYHHHPTTQLRPLDCLALSDSIGVPNTKAK